MQKKYFWRKLYYNTIMVLFRNAFTWKFRVKYGISPKRWERLRRRHGFLLAQFLSWELHYIGFYKEKEKRYEDYNNSLTHEQKLELIENEKIRNQKGS